jgi:DNA repair protein RadC
MNPTAVSKTEVFNFLVANVIYPMCSKKGKIFFRGLIRRGLSTTEKTNELIAQLNLKTDEDCKKIRKEVKEAVAAIRPTRPIKEWIKEERPREMLIKYGPEAISLSKLLAIILRTGKEGTNAEELSKRLLNHFKTLREIDPHPFLKSVRWTG